MASHTSAWHALHPRLPALTKSDVKNDSGSGPESGSVKFPMPAGTFESAGTRLAWLLPVGASFGPSAFCSYGPHAARPARHAVKATSAATTRSFPFNRLQAPWVLRAGRAAHGS